MAACLISSYNVLFGRRQAGHVRPQGSVVFCSKYCISFAVGDHCTPMATPRPAPNHCAPDGSLPHPTTPPLTILLCVGLEGSQRQTSPQRGQYKPISGRWRSNEGGNGFPATPRGQDQPTGRADPTHKLANAGCTFYVLRIFSGFASIDFPSLVGSFSIQTIFFIGDTEPPQ